MNEKDDPDDSADVVSTKPKEITEYEDPRDSLRACLAFSNADWPASNRTAWIWGIVIGWGGGTGQDSRETSLAPHQVERLKRLREAWVNQEDVVTAAVALGLVIDRSFEQKTVTIHKLDVPPEVGTRAWSQINKKGCVGKMNGGEWVCPDYAWPCDQCPTQEGRDGRPLSGAAPQRGRSIRVREGQGLSANPGVHPGPLAGGTNNPETTATPTPTAVASAQPPTTSPVLKSIAASQRRIVIRGIKS